MEIAQSQNTKAEFVDKATSFIGMATYGQIMIGDKAFEFYNSKNPNYIQIIINATEQTYCFSISINSQTGMKSFLYEASLPNMLLAYDP